MKHKWSGEVSYGVERVTTFRRCRVCGAEQSRVTDASGKTTRYLHDGKGSTVRALGVCAGVNPHYAEGGAR